jgi:hypothetical protein
VTASDTTAIATAKTKTGDRPEEVFNWVALGGRLKQHARHRDALRRACSPAELATARFSMSADPTGVRA